jgi:hypothetical protein
MKIFYTISLTILFLSCSTHKVENDYTNTKITKSLAKLPQIITVHTSLPLKIASIDYQKAKKSIPSQFVSNRINKIITEFYYKECSGDTNQTYIKIKEVYFNTIDFSNDKITFYLILLNQIGGGGLQSKLIFYNRKTNAFYPYVVAFNLGHLYTYNYEDNSMIESNLKEIFKLNLPEIEQIASYDNSEIFRFNTLHHNGTENAIETCILRFFNNKIDTLSLGQAWIGNELENKWE